jgi:putative ABC transport system permease protein
MSWVEGARVRLRLLFARNAAEARMNDEIRFHLDMEAERLMREEGLDAGEARRRALLVFGGVEKHREAMRDGRRPAWLSGASLDLKLGFRMLVKYPGLTVIGGLAMAFAICVGAVTFQILTLVLHPTLSLPDGGRVVQIRNMDVASGGTEGRALHDFAAWRGSLESVTDLGAFRDRVINLVTPGGHGVVEAAEITAAAFRIAADPPLLGRTLVADDERPGAQPVVVLGYDVWQARFGGDSGVIGRDVQLGDTHATVVGVMPEGYAFPVEHELWTPLAIDAVTAPRTGPVVTIFGRLAPGVSMKQAQAELEAVGQRAAADFPDTHEHLRPLVSPYARLMWDGASTEPAMLAVYIFPILLLVLICSNVALLLFARAATRESELVVRSALGATRTRIGVQLFLEALVLGAVAIALGLAAAQFGLSRWGLGFLEANMGRIPFWLDASLSPTTVLYAIGLTLAGAAVAGVLPALKVTRGLGSRLRQGSAGSGGLQFGGVWTVVIVAQVAATVAFPAVVYLEQQELVRMQSYESGFAAEQYAAVRIELDARAAEGDDATQDAQRARLMAGLDLLRQRVEAQPGVEGVTFVDRLPRLYHRERRIELDDAEAAAATRGGASALQQEAPYEVSIAAVDASYFDVLQAPILAGRSFGPADLEPGSRAVIVDQGFVEQVLRGRNPVGRRVRFAPAPNADPQATAEPQPWYDIVGVVPELGMRHPAQRGRPAGLYLPTPPGSDGPVNMIVHMRGDPMAVAADVGAHATAVDPMLRLWAFVRLDNVVDDVLWILGLWLRTTIVLSALALLLSLAGIYAVLSFTVARRTREIGVRVALGANRRRIVTDIFRRPLAQVGTGVAAGGVLIVLGALAVTVLAGGSASAGGAGAGYTLVSPARVAVFAGYMTLMLGVCVLACIVPTRRALGIEPTEALRGD